MKHYVGQIVEYHGEYEHIKTIRFTAENDLKAESFLTSLARSWYSDEPVETDDDVFYFNFSEIAVSRGEYKRVSKKTFEELAGLINDLT